MSTNTQIPSHETEIDYRIPGLVDQARDAFRRIGGFRAFHIVLALFLVSIIAVWRAGRAIAGASSRLRSTTPLLPSAKPRTGLGVDPHASA